MPSMTVHLEWTTNELSAMNGQQHNNALGPAYNEFDWGPFTLSLGQGNVFTRVCHSVHRGEGVSVRGTETPPGQRPSNGQRTPLYSKERAVCILLECILVDLEHQRQCLCHIWSIEVATHFWSNSFGLLRIFSNFISYKSLVTPQYWLTASLNGTLQRIYVCKSSNCAGNCN